MNAPLLHPVVPAASERQETAPLPARLRLPPNWRQQDAAIWARIIADMELTRAVSIPANLGGSSPYDNGGR